MVDKLFNFTLVDDNNWQIFITLSDSVSLEKLGPLLVSRLSLAPGHYTVKVEESGMPSVANQSSPPMNGGGGATKKVKWEGEPTTGQPLAKQLSAGRPAVPDETESTKIAIKLITAIREYSLNLQLPDGITLGQIAASLTDWLAIRRGVYHLLVEKDTTCLSIEVSPGQVKEVKAKEEQPGESMPVQARSTPVLSKPPEAKQKSPTKPLPDQKLLVPDSVAPPDQEEDIADVAAPTVQARFKWSIPEEQPPAKEIRRELLYAQFEVQSGSQKGKKFVLNKSETKMGRGFGNDILFNDDEISRNHARVRLNNGQYVLEDTQSINGTFINGKRLYAPQSLKDGDVVWLGPQVLLKFHLFYKDKKGADGQQSG